MSSPCQSTAINNFVVLALIFITLQQVSRNSVGPSSFSYTHDLPPPFLNYSKTVVFYAFPLLDLFLNPTQK